jgi:DNA-binding response OmpR family regulator
MFLHFLWQARSVRETLGPSAPDPVVQQTSQAHASRPDRAVVLVVDDDAPIRELLHLFLDEEYVVVDAAHGRTALALVLAQRVDLVLLDILLPDVDGLEILQELKTMAPDLPVIMTTGVKTVRTTVAAMKLGASDYLTKPFHEEELRAAMRRTARGNAPGRPVCSWWEVILAGAPRSPSRWPARPAWRRPLRSSTGSTACSGSGRPASC